MNTTTKTLGLAALLALSCQANAKDVFVTSTQAGGLMVLTDEVSEVHCDGNRVAYVRASDNSLHFGCWHPTETNIIIVWTDPLGRKDARAYPYVGWRVAGMQL